ncbi:hypothetical protein SESBI_34800 [Sesbania bispinosa]|nr:hypothetical protein SESBI_34800 [Sesbania bispinosa]
MDFSKYKEKNGSCFHHQTIFSLQNQTPSQSQTNIPFRPPISPSSPQTHPLSHRLRRTPKPATTASGTQRQQQRR